MPQNDYSRYALENLQGTLDPNAYQTYQNLNARFRSAFGSNNFGDFDFNAYMTNEAYRNNINSTAGQFDGGVGGAKQMAERMSVLQEMNQFFQGNPGQAFQEIDPSEAMDALREQVGGLADQQRTNAQRDVNYAYDGAEDRASEALAGTGLGRSGAAAQGFERIAAQRAAAEAGALGGIEANRLAAMENIAFQEANFKLDQKLRGQGWDLEMAQATVNLQHQMQMLERQYQLEDEYNPSSWFDTFGGFLDLALGAADTYLTFTNPVTGGARIVDEVV